MKFNHYLSVFSILSTSLILSGCSTPILEKNLANGEYAEVYKSVFDAGPNSIYFKDKKNTVDSIRNITSGAEGSSFYKSLSNYITGFSWMPKSSENFVEMKQLIDASLTDKLVNKFQHKELFNELILRLSKESIYNPKLLDKNSIDNFQEVENYRMKIALDELSKIQSDPYIYLERLTLLYNFFIEKKDAVSIKILQDLMKSKFELLTQKPEFDLTNLAEGQSIANYINLTGDHSFDTKFLNAISKIKLSKKELTSGYLPDIFPEFSKNEINKRTLKINITSQNDEFLVGEIVEQLKLINSWLDISDESNRKITLERIRFQENRSNPSNMTETVAQPNFSTILMIPKKASVLFDYTVTNYSLQWNLSAMDSLNKSTKSFSGNRNAKQIECRNFRYQNVFGGTGALHSMPNDVTENFCSNNSNVNFDAIRSNAIMQIASEINSTFFK